MIRLVLYPTLLLYMGCTLGVINLSKDKNIEEVRKRVEVLSDGELGTANVALKFDKIDKDSAATCFYNSVYKTGRVDIDKNNWYRLSGRQKTVLVAHELVHCECGEMGHVKGQFPRSICPKSIMHTHVIEDFCLWIYWDKYVEEMKLKCKKRKSNVR